LVFEMLRIIDEVRPRFVFAENSPLLRRNGLGTILARLAALGYDARWCVLGARDVGAPHLRKRLWLLAYANGSRERRDPEHAEVAGASATCGTEPTNATSGKLDQGVRLGSYSSRDRGAQLQVADRGADRGAPTDSNSMPLRQQPGRLEPRPEATIPRVLHWWPLSVVPRVDDGRLHRLDRVRATGNGQVLPVVRLAWQLLSEGVI
jgi:DNA (cytosine-5)-methyltransferase 1